MELAPRIVCLKHALFGWIELWAVNRDVSREDMGEPAYPALFRVVDGRLVYECSPGRTALEGKKPVSRQEAAAVAPELVRRAESGMRDVP